MKIYVIFTACLFSLAACHHYTNDYVEAKNEPVLKNPPTVAQPVINNHYYIPEKSSASAIVAPSLVPPGLTEDQAIAQHQQP
ncbi:MAG: hypothetical protein LRY67_07530 [Gammaproteobacteria bacterium]|nr:hypothetical protein [Gammaproteobacteria bacterium]MCD8525545.1 hypothetical protein [Gammaproteobacteria bacterium]MCD8542060.1 hypothetical protein [Gammaproteobacteria bacterium]